MKIKRIIIASAILAILTIIITLVERRSPTVHWTGGKDVFVRFNGDLSKKEARVIKYRNEPIEYAIERILQLETDNKSASIEDLLLVEPLKKDNEIVLQARGSGTRYTSIFRKDSEGWCYGFLAKIETVDGMTFYAWAEAELNGDDLIATFTTEKSQPIATGQRR